MERNYIALLIGMTSLFLVGCHKENPYLIVDSEGTTYDASPPSPNDLHLRNDADTKKYTFKRATDWPVRAIYLGWEGVYEFDRQGNILSIDNDPVSGYLVEFYLDGTPAWTGGQEVYYWRNDQDFEKSFRYDADIIVDSFVRTKNNRICPARETGVEYVEFTLRYDEHAKWLSFLSPHCDKASKVKINNREFWVYPEDKESVNDEFFTSFWSVQYFSDPITPVYDENGNCRLYCETEVKK